ncbi:DUF3108 domain-containing protein [Herbaspirillum hiltneri]|uniref:DUF3108 domain-containing protein n=1 Tax=Herbaspirillum hiltneri TaxID=341045 RepID=UPI00069E8C26|nr:DUF3108 domain-containing protein [Herbaspirillum hiltneri]
MHSQTVNISSRCVLSRLLCALLLCVTAATSSLALAADPAQHPVLKRKVNLPPSADLHYNIEAKQSGLQVTGESTVKWSNANGKYSVVAETRAMLVGKILEATSEGDIDEYGLAPARFVEKRFRREPSTTTFNRELRTINFTQSAETYPLKGGEQDRTSIIWQLISVARGAPEKFTNGSEWQFFVAGPRDAEQWSFKVVGREKIKTRQGEVNAVHIFRAPPPDDKSQKLDIWLTPSSDWYPVRLRFTDPDGDFIEQTLDNVSKK